MEIEREKKLIEAAREGDVKAFTQLVQSCKARVFAYMSVRMSDPSTAPELVADIFREIYSSMGSEEFGEFEEEVFSLAATRLRRHSRKSDSTWTKLCLEHDKASGRVPPLPGNERKRLEKALAGLEVGERHALELRFGAGVSLAGVSAKVKRSQDVVQGMLASSLGTAKAAIRGRKGKKKA